MNACLYCGKPMGPRRYSNYCHVCSCLYALISRVGTVVPAQPLRELLLSRTRRHLTGVIPIGHMAKPSMKEMGRRYDERFGSKDGGRTMQRLIERPPTQYCSLKTADRICALLGTHYLLLYPDGPITVETFRARIA